jgi:cytochrome c oxidase subunit 2
MLCNPKPFFKKGLLAGVTSFLWLLTASAYAYSSSVATNNPTEPQINNPAPGWDHLWHEVIIDITVIGVLFALLTAYFIYKYRRRDPDQQGAQPKLSTAQAVGWAIIPAFIFMADDFFLAANGWQLWNHYRQVPGDRLEIQLESGMYSWDYTYPNGVQTQNELLVPAGKPILLRMTSRDTLHSHYIPDFRVKEDSMPGRVTYLWFYPKEPGTHVVTCTEYCGIGHSYMVGQVKVMAADEFNEWYNGEAAQLAKTDAKAKKEEV